MSKKNVKKSVMFLSITISTLIICFAASINIVSANSGSISQANYFPTNGQTYAFVDNFVYQLSAVNTNTTVSVSIDGGPRISMKFQEIISENSSEETAVHDWYTWETTVPAITTLGNHTYQFFGNYYVWQETDRYWAKFEYYSTVQSFTIEGPAQNTPQIPRLTTSSFSPPVTTLSVLLTVMSALCVALVQQEKTQRRSVR
jgi:hypothetical protein